MRTHPHAEATYRIISLNDGEFGVEVTIPDTFPTRVTPFATKDAAEAWIARHKEQVAAGAPSRRFR